MRIAQYLGLELELAFRSRRLDEGLADRLADGCGDAGPYCRDRRSGGRPDSNYDHRTAVPTTQAPATTRTSTPTTASTTTTAAPATTIAPTTVPATAAPTTTAEAGGTYTAGQYSFADVQVEEDFAGDYSLRTRGTNNGPSRSPLDSQPPSSSTDRNVSTLSGFVNDWEAVDTITIEFITLDDYGESDAIEFQVDSEF